jgi:hypothetical protein
MPKVKKDPKTGKKDYNYRGTWKHKLSRARNLARRGGQSKAAAIKSRGRLPRGKEWWGTEASQKEWERAWVAANPKPADGLISSMAK